MITSDEIRHRFLTYFEGKDHLRIAGAGVVPVNDPTLLFINSGMAPLKRYFTGEAAPPLPRLCNVQPCLRTKDIEDVGDRHHLTFFEMLGSWSIGDYFKQRAVELAYELLVEHLKIPRERLMATVYAGDEALGLPRDEESYKAWRSVGMPADQIVACGTADNFWGPAGDFGPCGPCTEVFFDTGPEFGEAYVPGGEFDTTSRYIEIWNAGVFMEFNKMPDGSLEKLRLSSVDTGSGLERMAMTLNGQHSVYETDLMAPILEVVKQQLAGTRASERDALMITDHVRASTFILAEGVRPSNEGRGYIPRRLLRRVVTAGVRADVQLDMGSLVNAVVSRLGDYYPHLRENEGEVIRGFKREQAAFDRVVQAGLERIEALSGAPGFVISGEDAFKLWATNGMPPELIRELAAERGGSVDEVALAEEIAEHRRVSRGGGKGGTGDGGVSVAGLDEVPNTLFSGYEHSAQAARVHALYVGEDAVDSASEGAEVKVVTGRTPFYAEGGGQVGDKGTITVGDAVVTVTDTQSADGVTLHIGKVTAGEIKVGDHVDLAIDQHHRDAVMRNHSATHLMHAALRELLGEHVRQAGSKVEAARLRFDFQHPQKVTPEELETIERWVNRAIRTNSSTATQVTTHADAIQQGALAFFGENYGDEVRMVGFGRDSLELCGGTHVGATGDIGAFRIVSESSVGSGVRRIVGITGEAAVEHTLAEARLLRELSGKLSVKVEDLPERTDKLLKQLKEAAKKPAAPAKLGGEQKKTPGGIPFLIDRVPNTGAMRDKAVDRADALGGVVVLVAEKGSSVQLLVTVGESIRDRVDARPILKAISGPMGGKGGGRPHLAMGGAPDGSKLDEVLAGVAAMIDEAAS